MKTYISTFKEFDSYKKVLKTGTPSDKLILLSENEDPMIPFSMFDAFKGTKCKVDIISYGDLGIKNLKATEYLFFIVGKIFAEDKNLEILSMAPALVSCKQIISKATGTPKKKISKSVDKSKKAEAQEDGMPIEETEDKPKRSTRAKKVIQETKEKVTSEAKEKISTAKTKVKAKTEDIVVTKAENREKSEDDKKFDEQFDKLTELVNELPKTDDFDPSNQIYNIVSAVKLMGEQKITLEKAIKQVCSPLVADKLFASIKSKKAAIVKIIKEMPDDEK